MAILELQRVNETNNFETEWNQLLAHSLDNNPFLTYEWLTTWLKHFGKGQELKLFTLESKRKVSLSVPVMYSKRRVFGSEHCKVSFAASPDSDYQVFLVTDLQDAAKNVDQLVENIIEDSNADSIVFKDVPEDSVTARLLESVNRERFVVRRSVSNLCPYIPLPDSYNTYLQGFSSNMRWALKKSEKQALKDYRVDFVRYDNIGTVKEAMNILFKLHQKREIAKGDYGVFSNELKQNFHIEVANAFAENGWLALYFLTFNDKPVSTVYAYEYHGKLYAYLSGFDTEYSHYRPGYLIIKSLIQYAIRKKLKEFDFLRGEEQYKMRWRTTIRKNYEYQFTRKGLKSKLYNWASNSPYCSALYGLHSLPMRFLQKP